VRWLKANLSVESTRFSDRADVNGGVLFAGPFKKSLEEELGNPLASAPGKHV
jgi:hypothetical protein